MSEKSIIVSMERDARENAEKYNTPPFSKDQIAWYIRDVMTGRKVGLIEPIRFGFRIIFIDNIHMVIVWNDRPEKTVEIYYEPKRVMYMKHF